MSKLKVGMLVQPKVKTRSSYSGYAGRPEIYFDVNMLGVVRSVDGFRFAGVQVQYIDPVTGCLEHARVFEENLIIMDWPENCINLTQVLPENGVGNKYWFCGSMSFMGCVQYIKAIALYSYDYLQSIDLKTVRVPGVHASRLRSEEPEPHVSQPDNKQILDNELKDVFAFA